MKYSFSLAAFPARVAAASTPSVEEGDVDAAGTAYASAVTIAPASSLFSSRTLHANSSYASEISTTMANVTDTTVQERAAQVAKTGTFLWM
jgi:hypothetical protein